MKTPTRITTTAILKAIDCPHLHLYQCKDYWLFVYDTDPGGLALPGARPPVVYEERSVYTMRLSDMPFESWVAEGRDLVNRITEAA
jgi:hypothetical protein